MKTVVANLMSSDLTLSGLLTGGVHTVREITRQATPSAFDANGEVRPCALVKVESEAADGPKQTSGRGFVVVYFYDRDSSQVIDQAIDRLYQILHRTKAGSHVWEFTHANDVRDQEDSALSCNTALSRYQFMRYKG